MPTWLDVTTVVIVIGVTVFAVVVGLRRRQPLWAVVVTAAGVAVFLLAIRWAIEIGNGADLAVFLGALGFGAWIFATERTRRDIDSNARHD